MDPAPLRARRGPFGVITDQCMGWWPPSWWPPFHLPQLRLLTLLLLPLWPQPGEEVQPEGEEAAAAAPAAAAPAPAAPEPDELIVAQVGACFVLFWAAGGELGALAMRCKGYRARGLVSSGSKRVAQQTSGALVRPSYCVTLQPPGHS